MSKNVLDMTPVIALLSEAATTVVALDGQPWDDSNGSPSSEKAELSRKINHLADQLFLASGVVRNEYWIGKGFTDQLTQVTDEGEHNDNS